MSKLGHIQEDQKSKIFRLEIELQAYRDEKDRLEQELALSS